jgi:hypothetical protein
MMMRDAGQKCYLSLVKIKQVGEKSFLRFPFNEDMNLFLGEEYELYELLDFFHKSFLFLPMGEK